MEMGPFILFVLLCVGWHACAPAQHPFFVWMQESDSFELSQEFIGRAQEKHSNLNDNAQQKYFSRDYLLNNQEVLQDIKQESGVRWGYYATTIDGIRVPYFYFDRGSNELVVVGTGFPVPMTKMVPFLKLFPDKNIVLFDYRGQGLDNGPGWAGLYPPHWLGTLTYKLFGVDMNVTKLGRDESQDVLAVIDAIKKHKDFEKIYGVAQCYSASIFLKIAAELPDVFDKLIIDGCWPDVTSVIRKIAAYPSLTCSGIKPWSPLPCVTQQVWFQDALQKLTEIVTGVQFDKIPELTDYLAQVKIPILFFHGQDDVYCSKDVFKTIFAVSSSLSVAIITPFPHGRNYLWGKEVFKEVSNLFLDQAFEQFCLSIGVNG